MNRYATFVAITLTVTGLAVGWMVTDDSAQDSFDMRAALAHDMKVKQQIATYRCFKATLETALESLRKGEIRLKDAHASVYDAARRFNPPYLDRLVMSDLGRTVEERLARNLVGHLQKTARSAPRSDLETELQELLAELASRS